MATLPTDVIVDILSRLPPKPLSRFKCVAKSWNSLLNDPTFIKLHYSKSLTSKYPTILICYDSLSTAQIPANDPHTLRFSTLDHPVKHLPNYPTVQLLGVCNGLLCISDRFKKTLFLFNPSIKTHRLIPPPPSNIPDPGSPLLTMYNPLVRKQIDHLVVFGFGFDSGGDDYKLVRVIERYQVYREVRLFSMKENSWKSIDDEVVNYANLPFDAVHVNGILYFLVTENGGNCLVKCFDFGTETFYLLDMFDWDTKSDSCNFVLSELEGCLCVMANHYNKDMEAELGWRLGKADLWVQKEHGKKESWGRLLSITEPVRIRKVSCIKPVVYSKDGRSILLDFGSSRYMWYDWGSNKYVKVKASGLPLPSKDLPSYAQDAPFDTYTFVASLVPLSTKPNHKTKTKTKPAPKKNMNRKSSDGFLSTGFKLRL